MKLYEKGFFIGISVIFIISLFCLATISASSITVTAKPSASNSLPYKDYTLTWENHCPLCGHDGTLIFNPKGTYEGELTCSHCGADYCAVTGKDKHGSGSRANLSLFKDLHHQNEANITEGTNNTNNTNNTYLNDNMTIDKDNKTKNSDLETLILDRLNFSTYSQITATMLNNII